METIKFKSKKDFEEYHKVTFEKLPQIEAQIWELVENLPAHTFERVIARLESVIIRLQTRREKRKEYEKALEIVQRYQTENK